MILETFFKRVKKYPKKIALRYKDEGTWKDITWREYGEKVRAAAQYLIQIDLGKDDMASILSANRPEWTTADLAIMAVGGTSTSIYPNSTPDQIEYILNHSESLVLFVSDEIQMAKVREIRDRLTSLKKIVLFDIKPTREDEVSWDDYIAMGEGLDNKNQERLDKRLDAIRPEDRATIIYTSGTTGPPKATMLSHRNIFFETEVLSEKFDLDDSDTALSFLPLSHVAERIQGEWGMILKGFTVNFAESIDKVPDNLKEVRPTLLLCVPRLWEKIYAKIKEGVKDAPFAKKKIFEWSLKTGGDRWVLEQEGRHVPFGLSLNCIAADRLVWSKLRKTLGMDRTKAFVSGAAPLSPELGNFFGSLGIRIQEVFGQTECVGVCTGNAKGKIKMGTVGTPLRDVEVKIAKDGEVLIRGDNVFMGYYKDEKATKETLIDGWLYTGDIGEFDKDGFLRITDRKKDIIVTAGGKNVAPQNIENILKNYPGISQVVILGDKRKFLSAIFTLEPEAMARTVDLPENTPYKEMALSETVRNVIQAYVDDVNTSLAGFESVKKFVILDRDLTIEDDEITPTLKVKRRVIQKKYKDLIDSMYDESFE